MHGKGAEACSCPESRQKRHCARSRAISGGLGKDPKEVEERGEPFNPWSRFELPVIEYCRLTYPTVCGIAESRYQHGTPETRERQEICSEMRFNALV
jgi:hypothetical protein